MQEEKILVRKAKSGDAAAFATLLQQCENRIHAICVSFFKGDDALIQDVVQDISLRVWKNISKFNAESAFSTWVSRIAMNLCIDTFRRASRQLKTDVEYSDDIQHEGMPFQAYIPSPEVGLERRDLARSLSEAIATLSETHREIIVLREFRELSYQEIAEQTGVSIGTVMSRLYHARKGVQRELIFDTRVEIPIDWC